MSDHLEAYEFLKVLGYYGSSSTVSLHICKETGLKVAVKKQRKYVTDSFAREIEYMKLLGGS